MVGRVLGEGLVSAIWQVGSAQTPASGKGVISVGEGVARFLRWGGPSAGEQELMELSQQLDFKSCLRGVEV